VTLAEVIKLARKKYDLPLREVSSRSGLSNGYISQIENGKVKDVTVSTLKKFSKAFPFYEEEILMSQGVKGYFMERG
jgi:transcriptional regulator with XRE-family HTH domain